MLTLMEQGSGVAFPSGPKLLGGEAHHWLLPLKPETATRRSSWLLCWVVGIDGDDGE